LYAKENKKIEKVAIVKVIKEEKKKNRGAANRFDNKHKIGYT